MRVHHPLATFAADPVLARIVRVPFVATVDDVLSRGECAATIARIEALGPEAATINRGDHHDLDRRVRDNDRVIFDDPALAAELHARLAPALPTVIDGAIPVELNPRFRGYRYAPGQKFAPHTDGAVTLGARTSALTLLVYLNDTAGGETAFLQWALRVTPRPGMALLFEHMMLHEGCPVTSGKKYVLRSDVMCRAARVNASGD